MVKEKPLIIELRDYQKECVSRITNHFEKNDAQVIQLPTGAGKTIVFLSYCKILNKKTLILCPTLDLVNQINSSINLMFNGKNKNIHVKTVHHLYMDKTRQELLQEKFELIIIDEAHHSECKSIKNFLDVYRRKNGSFKLLGVTATPERLDGKNILDTFGELTFSKDIFWMIENKHLCDLEAYRIKTNQNFDDKIRNDDFGIEAIKILDNDSRNSLIYKTFKENCSSKKTLIFCLNINHCEKISDYFNKMSIPCSTVHGEMKKKSREKTLSDFKQGKIQVLTNCQVLTEGFDEPSIESLIIARPTRSKVLYAQMIGRGLRNHPGKSICSLYELTDNSHKICTFLSMNTHTELSSSISYGPRSLLSFLKNEITLLDIQLTKEKFNVFEKEIDNMEQMLYEGIYE